MLGSRVRRLAEDPTDIEALVEAVTLYHMVIEGMLALTGQHFIIDFNEREGTLPGFVQRLQLRRARRAPSRRVRRALPARHGRRGAAVQGAIQRTLEESLPIADEVLRPPWVEDVERTTSLRRVAGRDTRDSPPRR